MFLIKKFLVKKTYNGEYPMNLATQ